MTASVVPARTYGRYQYVEKPTYTRSGRGSGKAGSWALSCEPAVSMRVKRTFGRVTQDRKGVLLIGHTIEVARDLEWFMERFPLAPVDEASAARLADAAAAHRAQEKAVADIAAGTRRPTLPMKPLKTPRDYQLVAVEQLRTMGGLLLTDEVGLGKTFEGVLSLAYEDALPAVIVPPTHLPPRWLDEFRSSMPWLKVALAKKGRPYNLAGKDGVEPDVIILPYSRMTGWVDHLVQNVGIKTVIFDEVQDLRRGEDAQKGVAAGRLADAATYKLGLTATPIYNYAGEVWNILNVLSPGVLGSRDEFIREWGATAWGNHVMVADPAALGSYLREQGVMLGRTRKQVGRELPETIVVAHTIAAEQEVIEEAARDVHAMARMILDGSGTRLDRMQAGGQIDMKMRQATGVAKAPYVSEFVRMLLESEDKIVLFGWHRDVYDIWLDRLKEFHPVLYTGSESPTQKEASLDAFCNDPKCRVLIMSLRSGAGVDRIAGVSRTAVFGELDWSPQVHTQAIGRVAREGMGEEPAVAYYLNTETGSDPTIMEVLQVKRQQGEQVVSPDGRLFENTVSDVNRTRRLAEQILAAAAADVGQVAA